MHTRTQACVYIVWPPALMFIDQPLFKEAVGLSCTAPHSNASHFFPPSNSFQAQILTSSPLPYHTHTHPRTHTLLKTLDLFPGGFSCPLVVNACDKGFSTSFYASEDSLITDLNKVYGLKLPGLASGRKKMHCGISLFQALKETICAALTLSVRKQLRPARPVNCCVFTRILQMQKQNATLLLNAAALLICSNDEDPPPPIRQTDAASSQQLGLIVCKSSLRLCGCQAKSLADYSQKCESVCQSSQARAQCHEPNTSDLASDIQERWWKRRGLDQQISDRFTFDTAAAPTFIW